MFALGRMLLAQPQVVQLHLKRRAKISGAKEQAPPFSRYEQIRQIKDAAEQEEPGEPEMPVERGREADAQLGPGRKLLQPMGVEGVGHPEQPALPAEMRESRVDPEPARDHPGEHDRVEPVGQADQAVVTFDRGCHPVNDTSVAEREKTARGAGR